MNGQSADRQSPKLIKESIDSTRLRKTQILSFVNRPERDLELAQARVDSLKEYLGKAEARLSELHNQLQNHESIIDSIDAELNYKTQQWKKALAVERINRLLRMHAEIAALQNPAENTNAGNPDLVDEDMIVS